MGPIALRYSLFLELLLLDFSEFKIYDRNVHEYVTSKYNFVLS